ncbi:MAG TPA: hypothetical protein VFC39_03070 [Acidobacteriaceae bacterium]|nr:hypothetical protein [Acidobacteriaceae bacterium]
MNDDYPYDFRSPKDILRAAKQLVEAFKESLEQNRTAVWTEANFLALNHALPPQFDLCKYYRHRNGWKEPNESNGTEFLWDYLASNDQNGIYLVAESERATGKALREDRPFLNDFEKLLYVFSPLKMLICRARDSEDVTRITAKLSQYARGCTNHFQPGCIFILYCRVKSGDQWFYWQCEGNPHPRQKTKFCLADQGFA